MTRTSHKTADTPGVTDPTPSRATFPGASPSTAESPCARGVTLLVPAYNEEKGIGGVVKRLAGLQLGVPTEILVVDDGSTDGTPKALAELEGRVSGLRVIHQSMNRGYGASLKVGFAHARHGVVVITDADGTYPEERIQDLLKSIDDGAEMVVGARRGEDVNIPLLRRPAKAVLALLASYLVGARIPDLNSGMRAVRRELVMSYRPILPDGFSFTTTITLASLTNHHRVDYVSISYAPREGSSKIRPVRDTLGFLALIVRTVLYFNPLKVFIPLAMGILAGLMGSLYHDIVLEPSPNLSDKTVLLFVAFLQILSIGLLADLIEKRSRL